MKRIAHIYGDRQISNVTLAADDWQAPPDGSKMLENAALALGYAFAPSSLVPVDFVSMRALRFALIDAGLEQSVLDALAEIPDETEKRRAAVWWETSSIVKRNHDLVASVGAALGLSTSQIDALFQAASNSETTS